jgi:hypothetical protein
VATCAQRWDGWVKALEYYFGACTITDAKQKRAVLLHVAGRDVQDVFETLANTGNDYDTAKTKLNEYFTPKCNLAYERHVFHCAVQVSKEPISRYVTRLKKLAQTCEFDKYSTDEAIKDQVIDKCSSSHLRRRLLRESKLTLEELLTAARAFEASEMQASQIEAGASMLSTPETADVNMIQTPRSYNNTQQHNESGTLRPNNTNMSNNNNNRKNIKTTTRACYGCGQSSHFHKDPACPALGKICRTCGKFNHFASVCLSKSRGRANQDKVNFMAQTEASATPSDNGATTYEYAFTLNKEFSATPTTVVQLDNTPIKMLFDSGSPINIIDKHTHHILKSAGMPGLQKADSKIFTITSCENISCQGGSQWMQHNC